jgi:Ni,Fe-hydrogenase III small subunit
VLTSYPLPLGYMGDILGGGFILAPASFVVAVAALETGSPYAQLGSSRAKTFSAITEPVVLFVVFTVALVTGTDLAEIRSGLRQRACALGRSVHIRHVDAGSDGSDEWEVLALLNPVYDVHRLGIFFTASPRHADVLLVTGAGCSGMAAPLRRTYDAMPDPKIVIAAGTDAVSGGLVSPSYATRGGIGALVPVDVWVPGSPPSPSMAVPIPRIRSFVDSALAQAQHLVRHRSALTCEKKRQCDIDPALL